MANPFFIEPANPLQALMMGVQGYDRSQKLGKEQATLAARQEAGNLYAQGGDTRGALGRLIGLGDADTVKAIASMQPKANPEIEKLRALQSDPSLMQTAAQLKAAGATRINNSVNTGESAYAKTINEARAKDAISLQTAGRNAPATIGSLNRMEQLVDSPDFYSGSGAETFVLPFKQAIASLGGNPNAAAPMEEFRAITSKAALDGMGGSLGTGFSNADRDFITNQYPGLANTREGNKARVDGLRKIEQRKIEIAKRARDYAKRNGGRLDDGFDEELAVWAEKNPLFPRSAPSDGWNDLGNGIRIREKR